ncbi:MAG TPA: hypothetical protein VJR23_09135 [Candidatus Acidoferrales bacterium]|nr:hypothetical protein [Candidatus Acidoferrales bacterium]
MKIATVGLDIAKQSFQVHGAGALEVEDFSPFEIAIRSSQLNQTPQSHSRRARAVT